MPFKHCEILIHELNFCQASLQYVQNATKRFFNGTRKHDPIAPVLQESRWLPVAERIDFY